MTKPTPHQRDVLRALLHDPAKSHLTIHPVLGHAWVSWPRAGLERPVRRQTAHALVTNGWVEPLRQADPSRASVYRISTAGRAAIGAPSTGALS